VIFQGDLVTIVSLFLYGRAVAILGASGGAVFGALVPALSARVAIPLLDEWPNETDWVGIVLISAGVYPPSEGALPSWNPRPRWGLKGKKTRQVKVRYYGVFHGRRRQTETYPKVKAFIRAQG
jgi:hypothetical protein